MAEFCCLLLAACCLLLAACCLLLAACCLLLAVVGISFCAPLLFTYSKYRFFGFFCQCFYFIKFCYHLLYKTHEAPEWADANRVGAAKRNPPDLFMPIHGGFHPPGSIANPQSKIQNSYHLSISGITRSRLPMVAIISASSISSHSSGSRLRFEKHGARTLSRYGTSLPSPTR